MGDLFTRVPYVQVSGGLSNKRADSAMGMGYVKLRILRYNFRLPKAINLFVSMLFRYGSQSVGISSVRALVTCVKLLPPASEIKTFQLPVHPAANTLLLRHATG